MNPAVKTFICVLIVAHSGCNQKKVAPINVPPPDLRDIALVNNENGELVHESWAVHRVEGYKLGHQWTRTFEDKSAGDKVVRRIVVDDLVIPRFGRINQQILRSATLCLSDGTLLEMEYQVESGGQVRRTTGRIVGGRLHLLKSSSGREHTSETDWSQANGGFFAVEQSLAANPLQPGESRTIETWLPLIDQAQTVIAKAARAKAEISNGTDVEALEVESGARTQYAPEEQPNESKEHVGERLLRVDVGPPNRPAAAPPNLVLWVDDQGQIRRRWRRLLDQTTTVATQQQAFAPNEPLKFDVAIDLSVPMKMTDPDALSGTSATFLVETDGMNPTELIPPASYQTIKLIDDHAALVRVNTEWQSAQRSSQQPQAGDVQPNSWIESNHKSIVQFARIDDAQSPAMEALITELHKRVNSTLEPTALGNSLNTAAAALRAKAGDCTEHAMLLAAVCRARQIPARVAVGLIYDDTQELFLFHMWTEVWLRGAWRAVDATIDAPTPRANRIKISHSNLSSESDYAIIAPVLRAIGKMKIKQGSR